MMGKMLTDAHDAPPPETPFDLHTLGLPTEKIMAPGLYFDLDETVYHGSFALSSTGIKDFRCCPLQWWAKSPLNPLQAEVLGEEGPSSEAKMLGQAFDARIICGKEYFAARYAPEFDPVDHPGALEGVGTCHKGPIARPQ